MNRKEKFSQPIHVPWLAYVTLTRVYENDLLSIMYVQGHRSMQRNEWQVVLWESVHVVFKEANTIEYDEESIVTQLQQNLWLPILSQKEEKRKSLPSS